MNEVRIFRILLAATMTTTWQMSSGQELILKPIDKRMKGAQIQLKGAGTYPAWYNDVYKNRVRWHSGGEEKAEINQGSYPANDFPGSIRSNGTLATANIMGNGIYPVTSFGARANDSTFDCTEPFQRAIGMAASMGGGVVLVPAGKFWIKGNLSVPAGVTLQGLWAGKHSDHNGYRSLDEVVGSLLYVNSQGGSEDGEPFITLNQNSTLKGLTIYYPGQTAATFVKYPWTIYCCDYDATVIDVNIVNPYLGIKAKSGHYISNVMMGALRKGIEVDSSYCLGRIENVTIHPRPWYPYLKDQEEEKVIWRRMIENLEGYVFKRADWEYVTNCFVIFANVGMHLVQSDNSSATVLVTNYGSDDSYCALKVDTATPWWGASFQNCLFMGRTAIEADNTSIRFSNCTFMGSFNPNFDTKFHTYSDLFRKNGSGVVHLTGCSFPRNAHGVAYQGDFIIADGGAVMVSNCDFAPTSGSSALHLRIKGAGRTRALISNCTFEGGLEASKGVYRSDNIANRK